MCDEQMVTRISEFQQFNCYCGAKKYSSNTSIGYTYITSANFEQPRSMVAIPFSAISVATDSSSSPEFPIHVVQPYPTVWKPNWFKYSCKPLNDTDHTKRIWTVVLEWWWNQKISQTFIAYLWSRSWTWSKTCFYPRLDLIYKMVGINN